MNKQQLAYLGDAICQLIVGEHILGKDLPISIVQQIVSNKNMKRGARALEIQVENCTVHEAGTRYEAHVAEFFYEHGLKKTRSMVIDSLVNKGFQRHQNKIQKQFRHKKK